MTSFLRNAQASTIKTFYTAVALVLFVAASFNFVEISFIRASSNDQCSWDPVKNNDSLIIINKIVVGGVSDQAGLRNGDSLIRINGLGFRYEESQYRINKIRSGDYALYTIRRNGQELTLPVKIIKVFSLMNISFFLTGMAFLGVGLLALRARPKGELQQRFMQYCLSSAFVFSFGTAFNPRYLQIGDKGVIILLLLHLVLLSALLPQQIIFFLHFPREIKLKRAKLLTALIYVCSALVVCGTAFFREGNLSPWISNRLLVDFIRSTSETLLFSFYPTGLGILTTVYFSDLPAEQKKPIRPIIWAFFMSVFSLLWLTVMIQGAPMALYLKPELFLPMLLVITTPLAIAYSIFRYGLMDVSIIIERSLIFAIATVVLAVIYFATVSMLSSVVSGYVASVFDLQGGPGENLWITILAFVLLGLVFDPVKRRTENWVARVFYQERINYQKALLELSRELPGLISFNQIIAALTTRLQSTMHLERVTIMLNDERFSDFERRPEAQADSFPQFGSERLTLFEELRKRRQPVYIEKHPVAKTDKEIDENLLAQHGVVLAVPLLVNEELIGVIAVGKKRSGKGFSDEDLDLLMTVASQAAIAFENARLHESEIQKQKMEDSLAIARRIQQSLLPQHWPSVQGLDVYGASTPAEIVGGDFYDLIELSPTRLVVVVGDVSGKGISAALYMSKIQGMMQLAANRYDSPKDMLIHINRYIHGSMERNSFVTMIVALFDMDEKVLRICRAGHTKAIMLRDAKVSTVESRGLGIGLCKTELFEKHLEECVIPLDQDSTFVFYSDGMNEAVNEKNEQFGTEVVNNLVKVFTAFPAKTVLSNIEQAVHTFRGSAELYDDLTLVVVKTHLK